MIRKKSLLLIAVCLLVSALVVLTVGCGGGTTSTTAGDTGSTAAGSSTTAGASTGSTTAATGEPLIIGAAVGLTGDAASGDVPLSSAMQYSVDELNKAGGIAGHPVKLIIKI
jgi:ABC-type branched-subunit amino acid transport system substrate-binding protein